MINYPTKKLGEIAEVGAGNSAPQDKKYFLGGTIPFFRTADVGKVHFSTDLSETNDFLNKEAIENLHLKVWPKNTILFPKSGASTFLNHRVIIGADGVVASHLATIFTKDNILQKYIFYFLTTIDAKTLTADQGYPSLRISDLQRLKIPLPPINIQKQIVERLDKIAEAQKLNDKLIQKADELFQSLLHKELNPVGPADAKAMAGKKNWEVKKLKEVCEINPSKNEIKNLPADTIVSFLAMADVSENAEIDSLQERKLSAVKNGFTFFRNGDVIVAKITPCFENGKGAFIKNMKNGIGFGSTEFHVLRANLEILHNQFLYYLVSDKKFRKVGARFMTGSAGQQRVPTHYLENFKIPLPPIETQKQIVEKLSAVQEYKKRLLEQKAQLKELFDSALHNAFRGLPR